MCDVAKRVIIFVLWRSVVMKSKRGQSAPKSKPAPQTTLEQPETQTASASTSALSWFTQATIILALIPFIGYWCSLASEQGFTSYFGIPYYFISLNPTLILSTSRVLPLLGITLLYLISLVVPWAYVISGEKEGTILVFVTLVTLCVILIMYLVYKPFINDRDLLFIVTPIALFILCRFLSLKFDMKIISWNYLLIILVGFIFLRTLNPIFDLFHENGRELAEKQKEFLVLEPSSSNHELAVIRTYGEYLYAVPFNRITRKNDADKTPAPFRKELVILKMPADDKRLNLTFEKVGPLQPKPEVKP